MNTPEKDGSGHSDYLQEQATARRNFLKLTGAGAATVAGLGLLGKFGPELVRTLSVQYGRQNNVDIVTDFDRSDGAVAKDAGQEIAGSMQTDAGSVSKDIQESARRIEDDRIYGYNLWDTVNLSLSKYPIALIVLSRDRRISASSTAKPLSYTDENRTAFDNPRSFTTLSYIPSGDPLYVYNPRTWVHSGIESRHKFFAGRLEEALRTTTKGITMDSDEIVKQAEEQYGGARAYLLQAKYDDAFKPLADIAPDSLDELVRTLPAVNSLVMEVSALVRVPRRDLQSFAIPEVTDDPIPWLTEHAQSLGGFGFENAEQLSRWYMSFCAGSSSDEKRANDNTFHIDEGLWEIGFSLKDRIVTFDAAV